MGIIKQKQIIDFHTHVFPDKIAEKTIEFLAGRSGLVPYFTGTTQGLLASMQEAEVDTSVILPVVTAEKQFESVNCFAQQLNEQSPKLIAFGGIHPEADNYKEQLRELKERGFCGIKLHPDYQGVMMDDIRMMHVIDYASELGMVISVHAGVDIGLPDKVHCPPEAALKVIKEVKPPKLVLAHMGGWKQWDEVEQLLVGEEVFLDTAFVFGYIQEEQLTRIIHNHGSDKLLFATDGPWGGQKEYVKAVNLLALTQEEKDDIFFRTAERLLER